MMSKSFQQEMFSLIAQLTGQENVLAVPKDFIKYGGDSDTGLFLSQLIYWCDKGKRKDGYIYKTNKEWQEELGLSGYRVRKARENLEKKGILKTKVKKANGNPTVHYKILKNAFVASFLKYQQKENEINTEGMLNNRNSLTEITTEITTETTKNSYVTFASHEYESSIIYNQLYKKYFNKEHPRIDKDSVMLIREQLQEIYNMYEEEDFAKLTRYHFNNLPEDNDGKVQYFLSVKDRYLKEDEGVIFDDIPF